MKGRTALRKLATVAAALMLITGGIATVNPHTEQDLSPVGESEAAVGTAVAIGTAAAAGIVAGYVASEMKQADRDPDVGAKQEATQTKIDLYQTANQQEAVRETTGTIAQNGIRSSDAKLKMEAIQALDHAAKQGMTLTEAKTHVAQVVNNRTSIKQANILNAWSEAALTAKYVENRSDVAPNIKDGFGSLNSDATRIEGYHTVKRDIVEGNWTTSVTLQNGTEHKITALPVQITESYSYGTWGNNKDEAIGTVNIHPDNPYQFSASWQVSTSSSTQNYDVSVTVNGYQVKRNQSSDADAVLSDSGASQLMDISRWSNLYDQAQNQNQEVIQTVHSIADRKYSAIKAGEVKLPTNQNPYYASEMAAANNYSSQAFTASWLSSQGVANPEDWQDLESATIKTDDGRYLVGQPLGLLNGTTIREGNNYSVANTGPLTVATKDGVKRVNSGNYSVSEINGTRGKNISSLTFESEDLSVSNISEYRRAVDWMQEQQAESEAREQTVERNARKSGGGLLPSGLGLDSPFSGESAVIGMILLGIALLSIVARIATGSN